MDDSILQRISRIYAAVGAIEETSPQNLKAKVLQTDKLIAVVQDFRGGQSDGQLSNQAHSVIHNIANLRDHLRKWAVQAGRSSAAVDSTIDRCFELQIIRDLSNNDKHGYPPRNGGASKRLPQLVEINRVLRLQLQANQSSAIGMTMGAGGMPRFHGDGVAKAVVTGEVQDEGGNAIGDLYEITLKALSAWEVLLADFGLLEVK